MLQLLLQKLILTTATINPPLLFGQLYNQNWYSGILHDWINGLALPLDESILELGCGPGNLSAELAKSHPQVTGADRSSKMIQHANKIDTCAKFVHADALHLPMGDNEFNIVLLASLINVVPDRKKLVNEIQRVLKPDGMVSVLFPTPEFDSNTAEKISNRNNLALISSAAISAWAKASRKLRPTDICMEFSNAGFEKISTGLHLGKNVASVTAYKINSIQPT